LPKETVPPVALAPEAPINETAAPAKTKTALPQPVEPYPVAINTAVFLARGDALFGTGDIASARLFYERAADSGSAQAAIRLGETFDPSFLARAGLNGARGDPADALKWYKRARELGASEADILIMSIERSSQ